MELPEEIINIINSMIYKDSDQKSPIARLIKNSNDVESFITCKKINGLKILRSNNFYYLRCEILKKYHLHDFIVNKHSNMYTSVIGKYTRENILNGDHRLMDVIMNSCLFKC